MKFNTSDPTTASYCEGSQRSTIVPLDEVHYIRKRLTLFPWIRKMRVALHFGPQTQRKSGVQESLVEDFHDVRGVDTVSVTCISGDILEDITLAALMVKPLTDLSECTDRVEAFRNRGDRAMARGDFDRAYTLYTRGYRNWPLRDPRFDYSAITPEIDMEFFRKREALLHQGALCRIKVRDVDSATLFLLKNPYVPTVKTMHYLGLALVSLGEEKQAAEKFMEVLTINPNYQETKIELDKLVALIMEMRSEDRIGVGWTMTRSFGGKFSSLLDPYRQRKIELMSLALLVDGLIIQ